ncbi:unnamed protein product [Auanema sp. JU1783]|nr:unnamed protein product [Auanema sp. JU1783]
MEDEIKTENPDDSFGNEGQIDLLDYESTLLLDTVSDDTLFITARGLGMERLFLNHLIMYSDQKLLYLVLNTNTHDEAYFINKLKDTGITCSPKIITADVNVKDRQALYLSGGIQFITSRILLVDFLTKNVPAMNVAGILVYRAHQLLNSFQETFILRLYREQKRGGFVKGFTETSSALSSIGQLQRIVDRLYVKKVVILPRFHEQVRQELDQATVVEWNVALPSSLRRVQNALHDLIKVCMRELKQSSYISKVNQDESESTIGVYAYVVTSLERQLLEKRSFLTEKQSRILADLELLRELLRHAEDLDMATLSKRLNDIRASKEFLEKSNGWILSSIANRMFTDVGTMCGTDAKTFMAPPKWDVLIDILKEIKNMQISSDRVGEEGPSVVVFASDDIVCRQLMDVVKHGKKFAEWVVCKELFITDREPPKDPVWDPNSTSMYLRTSMNREDREHLKDDVRKNQIVTARAERKKRKVAEDMIGSTSSGKQTNIVQFGILQYKKKRTEVRASFGSKFIH